MIQKQKGTRDFYPEDKRVQNYIFGVWKRVAESFGYSEIEGPILESQELYVKSGQEIPKQMYTLKDKSGRKVALRPELTPTIARMIAQNNSLTKPIKWYSIPRCFRYEQPQSGRLREFFQFNIDCLGTNSVEAEAEVIVTLIKILQELKLTKNEVSIKINNKKLMNSLLKNLDIKKEIEVFRVIDKKTKVKEADFKQMLKDAKLTDRQIFDLLKILKYKEISKTEKFISDKEGKETVVEVKKLFGLLKDYNVLDFCELDLTIVRGLDYYTGTVFEACDKSGELRSIAGGGVYENLVKDLGKESCPGVGYGMGDVVIEVLLKRLNKIPELIKKLDYYIAPIGEKAMKESIKIAERLRKDNLNVEIDVIRRNLGKQLNYANILNVEKVIIIGEKDLKEKKVTIKDMKTGKEKKVDINSLR